MGKYIKLIMGVFLLFAAVVGGWNILNGGMQKTGMRIVENGVTTVGHVEKRVQHLVGAKVGRLPGLGAYYMVHYNFTTEDGKSYSDSVKVTKEQAYAMQDGQQIQVRYMNGQPSINSVLGIQTYMSEEDAKTVPWGAVIPALAIFLLGGLWLIWSGWTAIGGSGPSFSRKDNYQLDRAALLNSQPGQGSGGQPMFGKR
ncbi:MAG: DUF3592 domain-containing protein [Salaquimonas sp.]